MTILGIDHVQISIPRGRLDEALPFYVDVLGFQRIAKPVEFASHGGAWLKHGVVNLHLGEEDGFITDGKAHVALRVEAIESLIERAVEAGYRHRRDQGPKGYGRASLFDAFGNRVELMQKNTD